MTMQRHVKLYRLPETTKTEGLRQLKATDVPKACKLLNEVTNLFYLIRKFIFLILQSSFKIILLVGFLIFKALIIKRMK